MVDRANLTETPQLRILLVDDEPDVRRVCARALRNDGHHVYEAPDAFTALRLAAFADFDAALVDLRLPDADGDALVLQLRHSHPRMGLVAMTAHPTRAAYERMETAGADAFVGKPFASLHTLVMVVRSAAGLPPFSPHW